VSLPKGRARITLKRRLILAELVQLTAGDRGSPPILAACATAWPDATSRSELSGLYRETLN
jgi:hypothetical protein